MSRRAREIAGNLERLLGEILEITGKCREAIRDGDADRAADLLASRGSLIVAYADGVAAWNALPPEARPRPLREALGWHRSRIEQADTGVLREIRSLQEDLRVRMARTGAIRKMEKIHRTLAPGSRILEGRS
ncbi:MAG: hypothetical protein Kow00128_00220 [Deltaproteobacteria bacterium]